MFAIVLLILVAMIFFYWRWNSIKKDLRGKNVLITGAGMGIGRQMALDFSNHGSNLILVDIRIEGITELAKTISKNGGKASCYLCDVSNKKMVSEMAKEVLQKHERIDILVNNAGIVSGKFFLDLNEEDVVKTMGVNLFSHFWMLKSFLPKMIEINNGHIVTISSVLGHTPIAGLTDYCASKYAVNGFHESIRMELARQKAFGVKTTLVCPHAINTGMFEGITPKLQWIAPVMTPEYVSKNIVDAVKKEKLVVFLPFVLSMIIPVMRLVPTDIYDLALRSMGGTDSMEKFIGRNKIE
jgi:all-trans-retinol dehydrogenase (NAD+)